jgi:hypothetical protein
MSPRDQVASEVANMKSSRPNSAKTAKLDSDGQWQAEDGATLSDDDKEVLELAKHHILQPELASINDFLAAPLPERPTTGNEVSDFRDYLRSARTAKARRQTINRALATENPDG